MPFKPIRNEYSTMPWYNVGYVVYTVVYTVDYVVSTVDYVQIGIVENISHWVSNASVSQRTELGNAGVSYMFVRIENGYWAVWGFGNILK